MSISSLSQIEIDVVEYLIQHQDGLRTHLRPKALNYLSYYDHFKHDLPGLFQFGYEDFLLSELYSYLTEHMNLDYDQLSSIIDFRTIRTLWKLSPDGRDV